MLNMENLEGIIDVLIDKQPDGDSAMLMHRWRKGRHTQGEHGAYMADQVQDDLRSRSGADQAETDIGVVAEIWAD